MSEKRPERRACPGEPLIRATDLTRILPGTVPVTLVHDIDLAIGEREFVAITGPSGSGKSSLLYLLGLLDLPTRGDVSIAGRSTTEMDDVERANVRLSTLGFVFQFHFLLPEFTALGNVMLPMKALRRTSEDLIRERAGSLLASLGLADHALKRPDQLSGGQRQRVAVARALANDPPLILADEPTGSLDSKSSEQVFEILRELVSRDGKTVVAVTHDLGLSERMDRRINSKMVALSRTMRTIELGGTYSSGARTAAPSLRRPLAQAILIMPAWLRPAGTCTRDRHSRNLETGSG